MNKPLGRNLLAMHCLERVCVCPMIAPRLGRDLAPVCIVSSGWMTRAVWRSVLENSEDTHQKSELCSRCRRTTSERALRNGARDTLQICIDYKGLNKLTRESNYSMPHVNDLLYQL